MQSSVNQALLLAVPFWTRKITTDSHVLAYINMECPDDRYSKLKIDISTLTSAGYEYVLTLIKVTVSRFMGIWGF